MSNMLRNAGMIVSRAGGRCSTSAARIPSSGSSSVRFIATRATRADGASSSYGQRARNGTRNALIAAGAGSTVVALTLFDRQTLHMEDAKASSSSSKDKRKSYADRMSPKDAQVQPKKKQESKSSDKQDSNEETSKSEDKEQEGKDGDKEGEEVAEEAAQAEFDDLSEEASQEAAFDPETNTINWDCPCLGGMAHGPCGEQFKDAFSCFVFSEAEPKGVDCVEKFKTMQDCFRKYPEHYKAELEDEDETDVQAASDDDPSKQQQQSNTQSKADKQEEDDEGLREWRSEMEKEK